MIRLVVAAAGIGVLVVACSNGAESTDTSALPAVGTTAPTSTTAPVVTTAAAVATTLSTEPSDRPRARIGIRDAGGTQEFFLKETGERFRPEGYNLVFVSEEGSRRDSPITPTIWDPDWVKDELARMAALGFNTVRIFWDVCATPECAAPSNGRIHPELLDNVKEFLDIAAGQGMYAWISANDLPPDSWYSRAGFDEGESEFLTERNIEVYREYFSDLVSGLIEREARTDWIFAMDIRNEYVYQLDWPIPWAWTDGDFTAANGETYDMAVADDRAALSEDMLLYWADAMTEVVKSYLPDVLVTMATLTPNDTVTARHPDDPRWVVVGDFWADSKLDFVNIHGAALQPGRVLSEYRVEELTKPLVTGEYGTGHVLGSTDVAAWWMAKWRSNSCDAGWDGWVVWMWEESNWNFAGHTPIIAESISPALHPDPCVPVEVDLQLRSRIGVATASAFEPSELDEYVPDNVLDTLVETFWSAGAGVPQWLEIDLTTTGPVGRVVLPIGFVTPDGPLTVEVWGRGPDPGDPDVLLTTIDTEIAPGDVVESSFQPVEGIRYVRFDFLRIRDWVIIHDVEVWRD